MRKNSNFLFHVWMEKKTRKEQHFFFCFSSFPHAGSPGKVRDLVLSPSPPHLFFIGSKNYQCYFPQCHPSSLLTYLGDSLHFLSSLHVLLVKTGHKVYCGHKRDPLPWWTIDSACDEHCKITKTCSALQLVWGLYHQNHVSLFGNKVVKNENWTFFLSFKCVRWNKKKSPLILCYPLPNFELWCKGGNRRPQCTHKKMPLRTGTVLTSLVVCPNDLWIVHL